MGHWVRLVCGGFGFGCWVGLSGWGVFWGGRAGFKLMSKGQGLSVS
jgi:hypothetical protein